ncbi:MAG TPA: hypothetical protein VKE95_15475 [Burkholderiales bacterium]|nr:hypothetical protein [Burkholderiales bacterium]
MEGELSFSERLLLFLYGTPHIVGSVAALLGLALFFLGVIDRFWWAIVVALYVGGYLVVPRDDVAERVARAEMGEENLRERLAELISTARKRVPPEAAQRLESIRAHADALLPKLKELTERGSLASSVQHDVLQTLTRYLPDTLAAYLRLPPAYAKLSRDREGRTPAKLLNEQLRLLEENLDRAVQEAYAEDVSRLEVQGRFLSEKYPKAPIS